MYVYMYGDLRGNVRPCLVRAPHNKNGSLINMIGEGSSRRPSLIYPSFKLNSIGIGIPALSMGFCSNSIEGGFPELRMRF